MYLKSETYRDDLYHAFCGTVNIRELYRKSILITGATGLIGSFAADLLLYANRMDGAEMEIYVLVRDGQRGKERFASNLEEEKLHFVVQDVVKPLELDVPVDYIIHAAGDGFPSAFRTHPVETMTPALLGTYQLLQYAKEHMVKKFLYVSSGEVYGRRTGKERAFSETDCGFFNSMEVRSCYPLAKCCAEALCVSFWEQYHVPVVAVRPSHTYGACASVHDNRATVQFLQNALAGKNIILHSDGRQMRSYTYVADCVSGLFTVLLNGGNGEAYNLANTGSKVTVAEFADILSGKAGTRCIFRAANVEEEKEHTPIGYAVLDSTKAEGLGWKGQYDIYRGIGNMLDIGKTVWQTCVRTR